MTPTADELFDNFKREAVRLECLPTYSVREEDERWARFKAGDVVTSFPETDWSEYVRDITRSGRAISRCRVVGQPLTPYEKFELDWGYPPGIVAGEDIRVVVAPRPDVRDFWLFDREHVVFMNYDDDGEYLGCEVTNDAEQLKLAIDVLDKLLPKASTYQSFQSQRRMQLGG